MTEQRLADLAIFSAALGADPEQVQAAGGNTSLKRDGILWVKASGLWLADALRRELLVPVDLQGVLNAIAADVADPVGPAVIAERNPEGLRPSIETTLHALLPHTVVVHTHSVRTLALAIRVEAEALLAERLGGLAWTFVPYCHPGLPLTRAVADRLRHTAADVIVLGNHGLVVGADTVEAAAALLAEVERRLDAPVQPAPEIDGVPIEKAADGLGLRPAKHSRVHSIAATPERLGWATAGSLYPDHVIFLGPAMAEVEVERPDRVSRPSTGTKLFAFPAKGVLLSLDATESADELALCLALVLERVPPGSALRYLTAEQEAALVDWDAEKYRQTVTRTRPG